MPLPTLAEFSATYISGSKSLSEIIDDYIDTMCKLLDEAKKKKNIVNKITEVD